MMQGLIIFLEDKERKTPTPNPQTQTPNPEPLILRGEITPRGGERRCEALRLCMRLARLEDVFPREPRQDRGVHLWVRHT